MKNTNHICAAAAASADLSFTVPVTIEAASAEKKGPRRFEMLAYGGGELSLPNFEHPVVVDLEGMSGTDKPRPILKDHNRAALVGHTDTITNDRKTLTATGVVSGTGPAAREVAEANDNGFPWQASIGARVLARELVPQGRTVQVNGQTFSGPVIVARRSRLGEISFVVLGADDNTSARIAANAAEGGTMPTFTQWLEAMGLSEDALSADQKSKLKAKYDAEIAASDNGSDDDGKSKTPTPKKGGKKAAAAVVQAAAAVTDDDGTDPVDDLKASFLSARKQLAAVGALEEKYRKTVPAAKLAEITASAVENDWNADKIELELIRAQRPSRNDVTARGSANGGGTRGDEDSSVIEAALCLTAGMSEKAVAATIPSDKRERVMNLAASRDMRGYSLHALMDSAISAAGLYYGGSRKSDSFIETALRAERMIQASGGGFSTLSLSGVLSNVANKALISAYTAVEVVWNQICAIRSHTDFKINSRYRLDSSGAFRKVGPDGELKHIGLTDAAYTNQVDTYGAVIALTRQMMTNDDLGAFMEIPNLLGQLAATRIEEAVFTLLLSNPNNFFHANNGNLLAGGTSALSIEALTLATTAFSNFVVNGKPVLVSPDRVLVGTGLLQTAKKLYTDSTVIADGITNTKSVVGNSNPHAGSYRPVKSPYVNNTALRDQDGKAISGQSASKWWLFADPNRRAAIGVAFLNGQQTPTIESSQTEFTTLGMQWRAYQDFGVGMEDPRAALQSNGQ